jgi:preprotein translocase subunit SecA
MNDQRNVVYAQRREIMDAERVAEVVTEMREETIALMVSSCCPNGSYPEQWMVEELAEGMQDVFSLDLPIAAWRDEDGIDQGILTERLLDRSHSALEAKAAEVDEDVWREIEKGAMLRSFDQHWKEHLGTLDALRQVVHLRAYAQKNPITEYKREAFAMFERMLADVRENSLRLLYRLKVEDVLERTAAAAAEGRGATIGE